MIIEFKTRRNRTNGSRRYLAIDTEARVYTRNAPRMTVDGLEISAADYREMLQRVTRQEFTERDRIF